MSWNIVGWFYSQLRIASLFWSWHTYYYIRREIRLDSITTTLGTSYGICIQLVGNRLDLAHVFGACQLRWINKCILKLIWYRLYSSAIIIVHIELDIRRSVYISFLSRYTTHGTKVRSNYTIYSPPNWHSGLSDTKNPFPTNTASVNHAMHQKSVAAAAQFLVFDKNIQHSLRQCRPRVSSIRICAVRSGYPRWYQINHLSFFILWRQNRAGGLCRLWLVFR